MENNIQPVIRLAIADSQLMVRKTICMLIASFGSFSIDIEACSGEDLVTQLAAAHQQPDICVMEIAMPGKTGYDTLEEIKARWPGMKTLVLIEVAVTGHGTSVKKRH